MMKNQKYIYIFNPKIHTMYLRTQNYGSPWVLQTWSSCFIRFFLILTFSSKTAAIRICFNTWSENKWSYSGKSKDDKASVWIFLQRRRCCCESFSSHLRGQLRSSILNLFLKFIFKSIILVLARNRNFVDWMFTTFMGWRYSWISSFLCSMWRTLEWLDLILLRYDKAFSPIIFFKKAFNW